MTEWKEYKLGDLIQSVSDTYRFKPNEKVVFLNTSDILDGKFLTNSLSDVKTLPGQAKKRIQKGDILFSEIRPANKRFALVNFDCDNYVVSTKLMVLRCNENVDNRFIYTYLTSSEVLDYLQMVAEDRSGTFPQITFDIIAKMDIELPPLPTQRRIASILSSLDDKIDLLHRENATLEQMAETLFRQWFVVEAKEEWEEKPLGKCIKLVGGGTPKTSEERFWNGNVCWLSGGDIANNHKNYVSISEKSISEDGLNNSSAKLLPENAMVVSARGTVGKYCLLSKPMAFSQSNYGILPIYSNCYFFTYLLVAYHIDELQSAAYGSVFDTITTKTFEGVSVLLPKETGYIVEFEKMIEPYFSKMKYNNKQIQTLIQTRDGLLPRLMSGEVKI